MKHPTLMIIGSILLVLTGCRGEEHRQSQAEQPLPAAEVRSYTAAPKDTLPQTEVVGTLQAVTQAVIAAKVSGAIEQMPVVLGSQVKAGDLLVQLRAGEISAKVLQVQAQMEQARRNLERERKLLEKNAATAEMVKSLEEMYRIAEAAHREAKTMLDYTRITAPFAGVVTAKAASVGDMATPGTPLLHLEDSSQLQVVAAVPETQVLRLTRGDTLTVHIPAANLVLDGTVAEVAPAADPLSRTATVKLDIAESPQLRSGQFARVTLPDTPRETLFVPSSAVVSFGQMEQLFVIREGKASLRLVRTGIRVDDQVEILAGLEPGELVAIPAGAALIDGQPLTVLP